MDMSALRFALGTVNQAKRTAVVLATGTDRLKTNCIFIIEFPQGNDLSIVSRPKGLHINQPKVEKKDMAWSDGPSELL
jgi:hypothetical protein